jgi:hypothetical protein
MLTKIQVTYAKIIWNKNIENGKKVKKNRVCSIRILQNFYFSTRFFFKLNDEYDLKYFIAIIFRMRYIDTLKKYIDTLKMEANTLKKN